MGKVIVTAQIMPESPETNMEALNEKVKALINKRGEYARAEIKPIAFGLKALMVYFIIEDEGGIINEIESDITSIEGIQNYEVMNVQRAL